MNFRKLARADDEAVRAALIPIKGVGDWTVDIYLLAALQRPDVWPARDLALQEAARAVRGLDARPDEAAMREIGEAVAALAVGRRAHPLATITSTPGAGADGVRPGVPSMDTGPSGD